MCECCGPKVKQLDSAIKGKLPGPGRFLGFVKEKVMRSIGPNQEDKISVTVIAVQWQWLQQKPAKIRTALFEASTGEYIREV
jgi:hypothetical protein